ncbi:MAG: hypothetical protein E6Q50_17700 [Lysobacter sp.]|nr:MAG: hypothetical protein E6Q50_17700 [Lysobacter sp.]
MSRWSRIVLASLIGAFAFGGVAKASEPIELLFDEDTFYITFPEPMRVLDNQVVPSISIQPARPLSCHWEDDTALECSIESSEPLPFATEVVLRIDPGLYTVTGKPLGAVRLVDETGRPGFSADLSAWRSGVPAIVLNANGPIDLEEARGTLELRDGDRVWRDLPLSLLPNNENQTEADGPRFALALPAGLSADAKLELWARKGLASTAGPLRSEKDEKIVAFRYAEPFRVVGADCVAEKGRVEDWNIEDGIALSCVPGEALHLHFSSSMERVGREALLAKLPAGVRMLEWRAGYERWSHARPTVVEQGETIELRAAQVLSEVRIDLDETLRDASGRSLQPIRIAIRNGAPRPSLRAKAARMLLTDTRSASVQAVNAGSSEVEVRGFGVSAVRERLKTPDSRGRAVMFGSQGTQQALEEGGWVRWAPKAGSPLDIAAPQFDLSAQVGTDGLVAWALDWDSARPLARTEVSLHLLEEDGGEREIARAATDADGLARLTLPQEFVAPTAIDDRHTNGRPIKDRPMPMWVLRASAGTRHATLSLGRFDDWNVSLGQSLRAARIFVVADRPLYRAGDTLRYRGWLRESGGGRLRIGNAKSLDLVLSSSYDERELLTWSVALDEAGAFAGEIALPAHLVDGDYCVRAASLDEEAGGGACIFVGTFRAQDLWLEATTAAPLLRADDLFRVDIEAGYWSGGGASGVGVQSISTQAFAESPAALYPQYADYAFGSADSDDDSDSPTFVPYREQMLPTLDANGKARIALPLIFDAKTSPPAFGRLEMTVEAGLDGREAAVSRPVIARYARFERYVGLRIAPRWFDARVPLRFRSVVIDAGGQMQAGATVELAVDYAPNAAAAATERVATCTLVADIETPCDVPRTRTGVYRFTARSGDAAPTTAERYVWNASDGPTAAPSIETKLILIEAPANTTAPARVLLRQPYPHADALLVFSAGGRILGTRVVPIDRVETELSLPTFAEGRNRVQLHALVRERTSYRADAEGVREPPRTANANLDVDVPRPAPTAALALEFDAQNATPGQTVRIRVRNRGDRPMTATLSVLDDALRALAGARWDTFDPQGPNWLGWRESSWRSRIGAIGFDGWNGPAWQASLSENAGSAPNAEEPSQPVLILERNTLETLGGSAVGDLLFEISAADGGALANVGWGSRDRFETALAGSAEQELDRVIVTGSRIVRSAELSEGDAAAIGKPEFRIERSGRAARASEARALFGARVRADFADTALWRPEIRLAPGETQELTFVAPDNLTRWRAVAWSATGDEGFEKTEATLDVGLPLEARLQAPARVYPGDRAVLTANVRQTGDTPIEADATLRVEALNAESIVRLPLAARGQAAFDLTIAPNADAAPKPLTAIVAARFGSATDATAQPIELASPTIEASKVQAGWLGASTLRLDAPAFPATVRDLRVRVSLLPGADAMALEWIDDLYRYPHRCWEQILSRAVAAAIALERGDDARFPDARAAIREAVENVPVFQGEDGSFRYFADSASVDDDKGTYVPLTAYSVRGLALLRRLGHTAAQNGSETALEDALESAQSYLRSSLSDDEDAPDAATRNALALASLDAPKREHIDPLWQSFDALQLPAKIATIRAMSNGGHAAARDAASRVLDATKRRGEARVLRAGARNDRWMSSELREQCELIDVLLKHPELGDTATRRALIAGLSDLYAGGYADVDTQTGASCLMAIRELGAARPSQTARLDIARGDARTRLALPANGDAQTWETPVAPREAKRSLTLDPEVSGDAPASYIAEYRYREDARVASSTAIGFALQRRYAVLRDGRWSPLASQRVRDGDWVRITLVLDNAAERYFVAITDAVPGGLRPTDLALSGVAGLDLLSVSDLGAWWFETRRLDPKAPKFYAEYLPPGRHEVHYFARVGNAGDYLAAPAVAELMYGTATRARTAAERVRIEH